jgi:hypothetical protein
MANSRDDAYRYYGEQTLAQLQAELSAAQADLASFHAAQDQAGCSEAIRRISNARNEIRGLENTWAEYQAANAPRQAPELTPEEIDALPAHKMTVGHALNSINRTSKYAKNLSMDDPYVRHGYALAQQRRQRGE